LLGLLFVGLKGRLQSGWSQSRKERLAYGPINVLGGHRKASATPLLGRAQAVVVGELVLSPL